LVIIIIPNKKSRIYHTASHDIGFKKACFVGPAGFEPAAKRIQAQIQYGISFTIVYSAAVNLVVWSLIPIRVCFTAKFEYVSQ
jgi:hypothetical protein